MRFRLPRVLQIRAYPVDNGHEVIAYGLYAAFAQIGKTDFVVLYQLFAFRSGIFNGLAYGQALHNRPAQAIGLDICLQIVDGLFCPDFAVGHIVPGGNYPFHTDLPKHIERYFVFLTEPSPSLFHTSFVLMI